MSGVAQIEPISVASLICDPMNPRIVADVDNNREAIRAIFQANAEHQVALVEDIAANGLMPFMALYVAPHKKDEGMYVVLEGNRRTAALKALMAPEIVDDLLSAQQRARLRKASKSGNIPTEVNCAVAADDSVVNVWLERRHGGQQGGAGLVGWGPLQIARFRHRTLGEQYPTLMVLDFVFNHGNLERSTLDGLDQRFNYTNFQRFVDSVLARRFMGLDIDRDEHGRRSLRLLGPTEEVVKVWERIFRLVDTKKLKVTQIKLVEQQLEYIRSLGPDVLPNPDLMEDEYRDKVLPEVFAKLGITPADGGGSPGDDGAGSGQAGSGGGRGGEGAGAGAEPAGGGGGDGQGAGAAGSAGTGGSGEDGGDEEPDTPPAVNRTKLIPPTCKLRVRPARVHEVYRELQKVPVNYRNSVAVLMRVFVELSLDVLNAEEPDFYTPPSTRASWNREKLPAKVTRGIEWLEAQGYLTDDEARAARKAFDSQNLSESSITVLNGFVHNQHMFPDKHGMKTAWDNIQPFMVAIWNKRPTPKPQE